MRVTAVAAFLVVLHALAVSSAKAQAVPGTPPAGPGRISGSITDMQGQAVKMVGVTLRSAADSAIVTGVLSDDNGRFRLDGLPVGEYLLRVSMLGYKPRNSEAIAITAAMPTRDLGRIQLEVAPVQLQAVQAEAERASVVVEADRTTYSTRTMPVAGAGNATDVLRAVPELEVDVNNNVKLRGNQSVALHINGRPAPLRGEQLANFLQQMPGNRIDRVEVMPNPSAKHDPEGMGGIVNIVLKDQLDLGLSGNLSASTSTRNNNNFNGRINYQKGRLTLFTGAGVSFSRGKSSAWDLRQNLIANPVTSIEQNSRSTNGGGGWNVDWTAELKAGRQATLWSNAWLYSQRGDNSGLTEYSITDAASTIREQYDRDNASDFMYGNYNVGTGFKQVFQPQKQEFTVDARWSVGDEDNATRQVRRFQIMNGEQVDLAPELTLNDVDGGNASVSLQADYFRPVLGGRIDVGYRFYIREQNSATELRVFETEEAADPRSTTRSGFDYEETLHSLYATMGRTFGKFSAQLGLRGEFANTVFDSRVTDAQFDRNYNTLFPSLNVAYNMAPGRTLRFLYSKRISRPPTFYLDPFVPSTDPLNRSYGNPDLLPSYTQSFSMDFSYTGTRATVRVAPYYRYSTDVWERIRTVDANGVATSRYENAASSKNYGSNFSLSIRPTGRLNGSVNMSVYRDIRDGTNISSAYRTSALMASYGANLGIKLTPTLTAQTYANHFPTQSILQGRASGYTSMSLSMRQQVWGTKGSITVNVNDPLNMNRYDSSTRDATYVQQSRSSYSSRMAMIGVTYNFGRPPQQQSRRGGGEEGAGETIRVR